MLDPPPHTHTHIHPHTSRPFTLIPRPPYLDSRARLVRHTAATLHAPGPAGFGQLSSLRRRLSSFFFWGGGRGVVVDASSPSLPLPLRRHHRRHRRRRRHLCPCSKPLSRKELDDRAIKAKAYSRYMIQDEHRFNKELVGVAQARDAALGERNGHSTRTQHPGTAPGHSTRTQHTGTAHGHSTRAQHTSTAHGQSTRSQCPVPPNPIPRENAHVVVPTSLCPGPCHPPLAEARWDAPDSVVGVCPHRWF